MTAVECRMCRGSGEDEYGAECSDCDGVGVVGVAGLAREQPAKKQRAMTVASVIEQIRAALEILECLDTAEQELVVAALVRDLQSRSPMCVASMASQWAPTEDERDPREGK